MEYAMAKASIDELKEKQLECICRFLEGSDVFVSLPTGYSKSYIFALLPEIFNFLRGSSNSIVVCISPLTALIKDQKNNFVPRNIVAEYVGEGQDDSSVVSAVLKGQIQLLLISPESILMNTSYRNMLLTKVYKENLVALVIDEAHCVKTSSVDKGDEFRLAFSEIGTLRSIIPSTVNILALTATASKQTLDVIISRLSLNDPVVVGISPDRPNIFLSVQPYLDLSELADKVSNELRKYQNSTPKTVIFCQSFRTSCYQLYDCLRNKLQRSFTYPYGYPDLHQFRLVEMFHGGCMAYVRDNILKCFTTVSSNVRVVIATSSFGMGIDCPDIRKVIHWGTPDGIEQYVQEVG